MPSQPFDKMKSSLALLATAAAVSAAVTKTEWIVDVVTVTVTVDPSDGVQTSQSISTPTPEPVSTSSAAPSPPSPISAIAEEPQFITTTTTTTEAPPTSTIEPEPVQTSTPEPQPETTTKPQPSSQPEPETPAPADGYQATAIKYHNAYREDHSAGKLSWDPKLADYALQLAKSCVFDHNTTMGGKDFSYGQNLAMFGIGGGDLGTMDAAVGKASKDWYAEVKDYGSSYGQGDPATGAMIGHFTQLVWKNTETVGCATWKCDWEMPSMYTVCNYGPPGNVKGQYGKNVLPSLGLKLSL